MRSRLRKKLRARSGFTLSETLLAVIVLLIATAIVVEGIPMAKKIHDKVVDTANAQSVLSTAATLLRDELSMAGDVQVCDSSMAAVAETDHVSTGQAVRYRSGNTGRTTELYTKEDGHTVFLKEYQTMTSSVSEGLENSQETEMVFTATDTAGKDLELSYGQISYNSAKGLFIVTNLQVTRQGDPEGKYLADIPELYIRTVRP